MTGTVLDERYELVSTAPDRGMGTTWRASDRRQEGREVLVKLLRANTATSTALADALRGLRAFRHPCVPVLLRQGAWGDAAYLVFEALEGDSLGTLLDKARREKTPLSIELVRAVFDALGGCLAAAHAAPSPVFHGELSPGSVIVREREGGVDVRLVDLGLAGLADAPHDLSPRSARALVSPAPERAPGGLPAASWDVFAYGAVLREALGLPAEEGQTLVPVLADRRRPDVPPALWAVVERAMQVEVSRRFDGMVALRAALDEAWSVLPKRSAFERMLAAAEARPRQRSLLDDTHLPAESPPRLDVSAPLPTVAGALPVSPPPAPVHVDEGPTLVATSPSRGDLVSEQHTLVAPQPGVVAHQPTPSGAASPREMFAAMLAQRQDAPEEPATLVRGDAHPAPPEPTVERTLPAAPDMLPVVVPVALPRQVPPSVETHSAGRTPAVVWVVVAVLCVIALVTLARFAT